MAQEITVQGKATRIRGATWTHDQVKKLFDVWTEPEIFQGLQIEKKKIDIFKRMASILTSQGVIRKWSEVRAKIKNLKADFRKALEKRTQFRYYEQMKEIMSMDGSPERPSTSASSSSRLETGRSPMSFEEETYSSREGLTPKSEALSRSSRSDIDIEEEDVREVEVEADAGRGTEGEYATAYGSPIQSHSSGEGEIISNKRSVIQMTSAHYQEQSTTEEPEARASTSWAESVYNRGTTTYQIPSTGSDYDSRSMTITHVVSNVIEPVTSIVVPSAGSSSDPGSVKKSPYSTEETSKSPAEPLYAHTYSHSDPETSFQEHTPPPIRLEFLVDDENVILQRSTSEPGDISQMQFEMGDSQIIDERDMSMSSPPPPSIVSVGSMATPTKKTTSTPSTLTTPSPKPGTSKQRTTPDTIRRSKQTPPSRKAPPTSLPKPPSILREKLKQKPKTTPSSTPRSTPRIMKVVTHTHVKRRGRPMTLFPSQEQSKKRKMLETLNRNTVDTISNLLTETSRSLLEELQDSEQRFIRWEEERRLEERRKEEQMFAKLIVAMKTPSSQEGGEDVTSPKSKSKSRESGVDKESMNFVNMFQDISKRLNDFVSTEVKATEETLRQWESKMQRQESRHTEKIFAMLINAVKRPEEYTLE